MKNDLFIEIEKILDEEALRILPIVIDSYYSTNKLITKKIKSEIREDLKFFSIEIELRIYYFLCLEKNNIVDDKMNRYLGNKAHLSNYYEYCINNKFDKDHKKVAEDIRNKYFNGRDFSNLDILKLVIDKMPEYFKTHYDTVDVRTVILFL